MKPNPYPTLEWEKQGVDIMVDTALATIVLEERLSKLKSRWFYTIAWTTVLAFFTVLIISSLRPLTTVVIACDIIMGFALAYNFAEPSRKHHLEQILYAEAAIIRNMGIKPDTSWWFKEEVRTVTEIRKRGYRTFITLAGDKSIVTATPLQIFDHNHSSRR